MPMILGGGSITGLNVDGLPAGTVNTATLAANSVTSSILTNSAVNVSKLPAGTVLGMVYGLNPYRAGAGQILSTNSTSFSDSGIYCTYTPKRSDSLLLIQCNVQCHDSGVPGANAQGIQFKIYRDGNNLTTGLGGNAECASFYHNTSHTRDHYFTQSFGWVTTSNNTSSTTFRLWIATWTTNGAIRINGHDGQSIISVMEIAQ